MKNLTSSVYSFEKLRNEGYLYVDKTEFIWNLINPAGESYFLSRPRRFGKSLTLSTLKAVFEGKKELFKGLAIYDKPYDWKPYPIIHLDMANCDVHSEGDLRDYLVRMMTRLAKQHNVRVDIQRTQLSSSFSELIEEIAKDKPVVILLDEYDKPILENISNPNVLTIRETLADFYSSIKKEMDYEHFVFITGVSKFCHVSLFSKLNNLTDITMDARYATMFGYTQQEFETNFREQIAALEKKQNLNHADFLAEIKNWYDGFRFHADSESVYNPVSLARFFESGGEFSNYWFETGTPKFLVDLTKSQNFDFESTLNEPVPEIAFSAFEIDNIDPLTLLLQTGYVTIKSAEKRFGETWYNLDFPNREVAGAFNTYLLNRYSGKTQTGVVKFTAELTAAMNDGDVKRLRKAMEVFFAGISYEVHHKNESNFQNIFFALFRLLGIRIKAEEHTNDGRIDAVAETDKYVFIFEFKLDNDDTALSQIKEKEYYKQYELSGKKIFLNGVTFSTDKGQIIDWQTEEM
ncbi:MAG: ATP-binding protein [Lentisphaeria bacterium]|nr:ATP-binding protein [Lentisphaeria bacterium]